MPFDNAPQIKTPIDILDEMTVLLASPASWCRDKLYIEHNKGISRCLYGALNQIDHGSASWHHGNELPRKVGEINFRNEASKQVQMSLIAAARDKVNTNDFVFESEIIALFNNTHSHTAVLNLIKQARQTYIAE
jgi:hypothetical protein